MTIYMIGLMTRFADQIKEQRATAIGTVQKLIRNLMLTLLHNTSQPVCTLPENHSLCDSSNLGCLLQTFPQLCDSNADDFISNTVTSTMSKIQHVQNYGSYLKPSPWDSSRRTNNHANCGFDKILLPELTAIIHSVEGLVLNPKVPK